MAKPYKIKMSARQTHRSIFLPIPLFCLVPIRITDFVVGLAGMKTAKQKTAGEVKPRSRPRAKRIQSTGARFTISDELWALMEPLLAEHQNTHRFGGGRPRVPDRQCADGIFFVLRTG